MKNRYLILTFVFFTLLFVTGTKTYSLPKLPDSIVQIKRSLEKDISSAEKLPLLRSLTLFYKDTISRIAQVYGHQYLKIATETNSLFHQALAHSYLAKTYRDQLDNRKSLFHNLKSLDAFGKYGDAEFIAYQWLNLSDSYLMLHQFDSALYYYQLGYDHAVKKMDDERIIFALIQVGKVLSFQDNNTEALQKFNAALDLSERIEHKRYIGWVSYWLGFTNMKLGNFTEAETYYLMSESTYEELDDGFSRIGPIQELGDLYLKTGRYAEAYSWFFEGVENVNHIPGARSSKNFKSSHSANLGKVYLSISDFDRAMAYFDTSMSVAVQYNFPLQIASANSNIGRVYFKKAEYDDALKHYFQALAYYNDRGSRFGIADLLNKIGGVYEYSNDFEAALRYYSDALTINKEIGNKFGIAQNRINIVSVYSRLGNLRKVGEHLDAGIDYAEATGVNILILRYYGYYVEFCEKTHDHPEAHHFFDKYLPLSQKVNQENITNLTALLLRMHNNELEKSEAAYQQELNLRSIKSERDRLKLQQMFLVVIVVALIALVTGLLLFIKFLNTRRLEKLVVERTKELKEKELKLIEVNETREKFYSIIAHDLKSPFNSLIGFSNLLLDDYDDFGDKERKEFVEIIRNSSENIFDLLENLLDWTRRSSDDFDLKPVKLDLFQAIKKTLQLQEKNAEAKQISIINKIPKNSFAFADENVVLAILRNLTSNAIKFSNPGDKILYEVKKSDGFLYCSVEDNGIGMTESEIEKILNSNKSISKKGTGKEKGTGLGLRLVSDFVERSGGKITIESVKGHGSKFIFSLPAK